MPQTIVKKVELYENNTGRPIRFTVADGTQISKGILLKLTDARTASAHTNVEGTQVPSAGISAMAKEASDGSTSISAWTQGIFELRASGAIAIGTPVAFLGYGHCEAALDVSSGAIIVGHALEAADAGEIINIKVNL